MAAWEATETPEDVCEPSAAALAFAGVSAEERFTAVAAVAEAVRVTAAAARRAVVRFVRDGMVAERRAWSERGG
ncbi:hypothetical protein Kisp01_33530 [Kineosporia sp. NBRC 101677]|nr:hypothetical protein Kisp01_33530 [Kineosporia sp. NBRC 101677]